MSALIQNTKFKPKCHICGAGLLIGARLVIRGRWTCGACAYEAALSPSSGAA